MQEKKYTVEVPVPLGTTLYTYMLRCCDACVFQKEIFDQHFYIVGKDGRCGYYPCRTKYMGTRDIQFSLKNIESVLENFGKSYFLTPEEAESAGKMLVSENIKKMKELGFTLTEDGYSPVN